MPRADLHVHTLYSDGTFTPREALTLARDRVLDTVAITDHDTTAGLDEAFEAGAELGVAVIPGIEFATVIGGQGFLVLCYYMELDDAELNAQLARRHDECLLASE